ncbi:IS110 family transposase [Prosthecomicrobium hirschii]|uniref:IS110 family transposase n=1 Tax=Prosthecodimorpha hirschii TaxID=665126 RepID=UPI000A43B4ED|nr:IS110 family transposase [Prosthecomicrobium hirschii]
MRISDLRGRKAGERIFAHGGEGLADMAGWLVAVTGVEPDGIDVAIEVPHGPVVESLLERGFRVHAINPKQLDRFRDRFSPAGAKDDSRDAEVLADALRTDRRCFRRLAPLDPVLVELREWSRMAEELRAERNRLGNRVREQLWRYYPQVLDLADDVAAGWFLDLWALLPTPEKARRVREETVARLLKRHRIRRFTAADVLERLRRTAVLVAPGTTEAAVAHVQALAKRLDLVNRQNAEAETRLDRLTERMAQARADAEPGEPGQDEVQQGGAQRDVTILRSLPGVGRVVLATLLAEAWEALQRRDYHALRCLCGVAPVTKRSGKSKIVQRRQAAHQRLANAVYHWSRAPYSTTPEAAPSTPHSASAVTVTPAPCVPSETVSSPSPEPCSKPEPHSIRLSLVKEPQLSPKANSETTESPPRTWRNYFITVGELFQTSVKHPNFKTYLELYFRNPTIRAIQSIVEKANTRFMP